MATVVNTTLPARGSHAICGLAGWSGTCRDYFHRCRIPAVAEGHADQVNRLIPILEFIGMAAATDLLNSAAVSWSPSPSAILNSSTNKNIWPPCGTTMSARPPPEESSTRRFSPMVGNKAYGIPAYQAS